MLDLSIYRDTAATQLVLACSAFAEDVRFTTNEHGFEMLAATLPMSVAEALRYYQQYGVMHVRVDDNGFCVWEGRLEDPELYADEGGSGLVLTAYGYQNAYRDVPYTALWSTQDVSQWRPVTTVEESSRAPERYATDTTNRIYIAPQKSASLSNALVCSMTYETPDDSARDIVYVTFDYRATLPSTDYRARVVTAARDFSGISVQWTRDGSQASASHTVGPFTGATRVMVELYLNLGTAATYGGETGQYFAEWTNMRIATLSGSPPHGDEIAEALVSYVAGVNPTQVSASTAWVQAPGYDLKEEVYEDMLPADILDKLVKLGDTQTPPRTWEWAVWERRELRFQPRGSSGRTWYVDAASLRINRSLSGLANSSYAVYQDYDGETQRTAVSTSSESVTRFGLTRRQAVATDTTNAAQAAVTADAVLLDGKRLIPQVQITFDAVQTASSGTVPLYYVRAGDTIVVRNIPTQLSAVDGVAAFRIIATEYADGVLTVTPESPIPTIDTLLARREEKV